ncbi:MAG: ATP-binding protein, partial [Candidatus Micrarchaeaceae archaeon]
MRQSLMFEDRFLESWVGSVITSPATAIVELVANCWDAYATEVNITWPDSKENGQFSIKDNGVGMTLKEFKFIWWVMSYDRVKRYGLTTKPPPGVQGSPRPVFGRNGKGRFATFCFSSEYLITSRKDGEQFTCRVYRTIDRPLVIEEKGHIKKGVEGHGTEIVSIGKIHPITLSEAQARESLGSRFLVNPAFRVLMNGEQ